MKHYGWQILLGIILILLSVLFYFFHYVIFKDAHHIFIYLVGDVAFVFFEVLLVTLIIHRVLEKRDRRVRLEKLNMVIGAFFSEVGTQLLRDVSALDPEKHQLKEKLLLKGKRDLKAFEGKRTWLTNHDHQINGDQADLEGLKRFLLEKREFLLRLLENPNVLEHESFTNLLRAVFHLTEELGARHTLLELPSADLRHLAGDIKRAYKVLTGQWLEYMNHLKNNYPYLFSLALRTNPFDDNASVILKEAT